MKFGKCLVASALVAGLLGIAMIGPAAAHKRVITDVFINTDYDNILVQAWVEPECHAGTMNITLKKRNSAGDWVAINTKKGVCQLGWGYTTNFNPPAGDKRCKAIARFNSNNHPTLSKASPIFDC